MFVIVVLGILAAIFLVSVLVAVVADKEGETFIGSVGSAIIVGALFAIVWVACSFSSTPARNVGIEIQFGQATDTLTPGLNWVAPWASVENMPTTSQTLDLDATDNTDASKAAPVGVKFKGGGAGGVNMNMNYHITSDDSAIKLWNQWKDFELVKDKVVNPKAQSIVYQIVGKYTPEEAVDGTRVAALNTEIKEALNTALASDGVTVENVLVKKVDVDPTIQDRINKQVEDLADQNRAKIQRDTAAIIAERQKIAQQAITPSTLAQDCLTLLNNWNVVKNGPIPAGFTCLGSGGIPLSIPAK